MTKHSHIIILFLLMSVLAMSCAYVKYKHLLADVNSYIRERPDSALVVLRSIDRCDLRSRNYVLNIPCYMLWHLTRITLTQPMSLW